MARRVWYSTSRPLLRDAPGSLDISGLQVNNFRNAGTILVFSIIIFLVACETVDVPVTSTPQTQTPFVAPDTPPPIIITITETSTSTPGVLLQITDTPVPVAPIAKWWEVYFTDPLTANDPGVIAGSIEEKLIQFIGNAQSSIHIASFEFNLTPVAEALIAAKQRGLDVEWVTDDENGLKLDTQPGRGQFASLTAVGIQVKDDAGRSALMHNKFWIFDQQVVWTGSTNITVNGIFKQNNNVLVIRSSEIAYIYEREFQELWAGQLGPHAPSTVNNQWAIVEGTPVQVLFSAEDQAVENLIALINDARVSIRFLAFSFTDYPLAKAMIDRAAQGVDVKGVYETFGSASESSELRTFLCARIPVRQDGNPSFLHDKIIVVDNTIVVTGSLNYSSSADNENEENVVILDNAEVAAMYLQEFEKLWGQAHEADPGVFPCQ